MILHSFMVFHLAMTAAKVRRRAKTSFWVNCVHLYVDIGLSQVLISKIQEFTHQYKQRKNEVTNQQTLLL